MKKILLLAAFTVSVSSLLGQVILTQETHGFFADQKNPMVLTHYVDPGVSGKNVVWDFSRLEVQNSFTGNIENYYTSKCCSKFSKGNVVLEEFGNFFIFESTPTSLEQIGYMSGNGVTRFEYTKPFVKMQYPFTYGSSYSGNFDGNYIVNDNVIGSISGTFLVEGDGFGRLILPNGRGLDNVLRVKEVRTTKQVFSNGSALITDITYRWYVSQHRFPVLVLIRSEVRGENSEPVVSTRAAYNSNVMNATTATPLNGVSNVNLSVYPNPYSQKVKIEFTTAERCQVNLSIYDLSGKVVKEVENSTLDAGLKRYEFSAKALGLTSGVYVLKLRAGQVEETRKLIEL
ncbi:MAG: T9SS type A sorting domain-containing protein [Bacteroidota bacterium]